MARWTPDPSFYPSPRLAAKAPAETLAYVATFAPKRDVPDAIAVVDADPSSASYSKIVSQVDMTALGDELHHYGWNACSSCLCPNAPHPHVERRYLVVPGLRSSRIYIDTKADPTPPDDRQGDRACERTGYSRPHTVHCGPEGIYVSALGNATGDGPGGIFLMDSETFEVLGRWEVDRGPQTLAYDAWWHLGYDTLVTSEWGTPNTVKTALSLRFCSARTTDGVCIFGICTSVSMCRKSILAPSISSCSSSGRRTTRPRPTASSMP
jgi:selenium-binding protein 1